MGTGAAMDAPGSSGLSLAEELLLIALDDEKGVDRTAYGAGVETGLAGAILLELAGGGCVREDDGRLVAVDGSAPEDGLAADALETIRASSKQRKAKDWVSRLPRELKPLRDRVAEGLVGRGVLTEERTKRLGLFKTVRYPERAPEPERRLRASLSEVLLGERSPSDREAMLIALLHPYDLIKVLVPKDSRKDAKKRAKEIAKREVIGAAVGDAVRDVQIATSAAILGASAAAASGSGGDGGGDGGGGG